MVLNHPKGGSSNCIAPPSAKDAQVAQKSSYDRASVNAETIQSNEDILPAEINAAPDFDVGQVSMAPVPLQIPTVCANPLFAFIVAMLVFDDVQLANVVTSCVPLGP